MALTLQSIEQQISELQRKAAKLRSDEVDGVIDRIKGAIAHYGLTAEQLGLSAKKSTAKQRAAKPGRPQSRCRQVRRRHRQRMVRTRTAAALAARCAGGRSRT